jgi:hypothetical protein
MYAALAAVLLCVSCGTDSAEPGMNAETEKPFDAVKINEADWVETDLGKVSPMTPITVKLPKDAVLEKNGNGGVDVKIGDYYVISVYASAVSSAADAVSGAKSLTVDDKTYYENGKLLIDEPNGFVYTNKMKDEANFKYQPESHFFYVYEAPGQAFFTFEDNKTDFDTPGSAFPEENARKVYAVIKGSARMS